MTEITLALTLFAVMTCFVLFFLSLILGVLDNGLPSAERLGRGCRRLLSAPRRFLKGFAYGWPDKPFTPPKAPRPCSAIKVDPEEFKI